MTAPELPALSGLIGLLQETLRQALLTPESPLPEFVSSPDYPQQYPVEYWSDETGPWATMQIQLPTGVMGVIEDDTYGNFKGVRVELPAEVAMSCWVYNLWAHDLDEWFGSEVRARAVMAEYAEHDEVSLTRYREKFHPELGFWRADTSEWETWVNGAWVPNA